jgi:peroxiredoxin
MNKILCCAFLFFSFHYSKAQNSGTGKPVEEPDKILKTEMNLLYYNRDYLRLSEDFTAYNRTSQIISREKFFELFASGEYLPLRLLSKDGGNYYKLYKVNALVDIDILTTLKQWGELDYKYFKMEGKPLPGFNFTDLNGKVYNPKTTKGKIVIIKCWFLACAACNEEIPQLNQLVDYYKNRKDIVFVSLAFDPKKKLEAFMKKKTFKYAIAPVKESYIEKELNIQQYPTHLIINKQGLIAKVVNDPNELTTALNTEASK